MNKKQLEQGFSLIELLIVLAIIGTLAGVIMLAVGSARVKGRDSKRAGDMRQSITALEQYYIQHGVFPTGTGSIASAGTGALFGSASSMDGATEAFTPTYLPIFPGAPSPADSPCDSGSGRGKNNYWYDVANDGSTYTLTFCLGGGVESWAAGIRSATPNGVQ